jgi:hypothetical protein
MHPADVPELRDNRAARQPPTEKVVPVPERAGRRLDLSDVLHTDPARRPTHHTRQPGRQPELRSGPT